MLLWRCPSCQQELHAAPEAAGQMFTCPRCSAQSAAPGGATAGAAPPFAAAGGFAGTSSSYGPMPMGRRLMRSRRDRMLSGVCGGIAEWIGWDPTIVRVLYVLASFFSVAFPGVIVYVILMLTMPESEA